METTTTTTPMSNDEIVENLKTMVFGVQAYKRFNAKERETLDKAWNLIDQYENRLKADMVAMLTDIQLEIEEKYPKCDLCEYFVDYDYDENDISEYRSVGSITDITNLIQEKIDKEKSNEV